MRGGVALPGKRVGQPQWGCYIEQEPPGGRGAEGKGTQREQPHTHM